MSVFIIILNWNGKNDTLECLDSVFSLGSLVFGLEVVVVDNASADGSVVEISKRYPNVRLLENKKNLGFAEGNNVGLKYALENGADYTLILNNDTLVDKNLVEELLKIIEKDPKIGIAGPKIYFAPGFEYHHQRYQESQRGKVIWYAGGLIDWQNVYASHRGVDEVDNGQYNREEETDFVSGCAMMIKREVLEKVGLFDQKYFLYYEDNDLCQRAKRVGFKLVYVPRAFLWHKNASSSDKPGSLIHQYYLTRNRFLFGLKYAPLKSKLALLRESFKFLWQGGIKRQATLDFYLGKFAGAANL